MFESYPLESRTEVEIIAASGSVADAATTTDIRDGDGDDGEDSDN